MVGAGAADQVLAALVAAHGVIQARELRGGLDRVPAAAGQEHLRTGARSEPDETLGQLQRGPVGHIAEGVIGLELGQLSGNAVSDLTPAVTDVRIPQACGAVEILPARLIPDEHALAAGEDELVAVDGGHAGDGMPQSAHAVAF